MASRLESGRILLNETELAKFYSLCVVDLATGCWNWTGWTIGPKRYGGFSVKLNGTWLRREAYWLAYNHFVGPVPEDKELGHTSPKDKCAFWEHVRPITHAENMREMGDVHTVCVHGHDTSIWGRTNRGHSCKVCHRIEIARREKRTVCLCCGYKTCVLG